MSTSVKVDLKAEIDSSTTKELVSIISDVLAPASELMGAIGDNIRAYRVRSAINAFKRARELAEKTDIRLNAPPAKFLIPFIEEASLESDDSPLTESWAKLLVTAASGYEDLHRSFAGVLRDLTPASAKLLEYIFCGGPSTPDRLHLLKNTSTSAFLSENLARQFEGHLRLRDEGSITSELMISKANAYLKTQGRAGTIVVSVEFSDTSLDKPVFYTGFGPAWADVLKEFSHTDVRLSSQLLAREFLVTREIDGNWTPFEGIANLHFRVSYLRITEMGVEFVKACIA